MNIEDQFSGYRGGWLDGDGWDESVTTSLGLTEADLLVANIKHSVVLSNENISQDPHPIQAGR